MSGVELLQSQFQQTSQEKSRYAAWAKEEILQRLAVGGRIHILENSVCDLEAEKDNMNNSCMNAAPFIAQELLRAAIASNDQELAELNYLVFKQYSSALRPDGSQAHDSIRDCYVVNYTIWAATFLHECVYLAHTIGINLWEDRFSSKHGSPRQNIEYAIKIIHDPNIVNEYTQDFGFPDCVQSQKFVESVSNYPKSAFAYYLEAFAPEKLDDIYLKARDALWSCAGASGVNYGVDLVAKRPQLQIYFMKNKQGILNQRAQLMENLKLENREQFLKEKV